MTDQPTPKDQDDAEAARTALNGSDAGSDTRAGSLQGGSATGSERDEAQVASDKYLADLGPELKAGGAGKASAPKGEPPKGVTNTGHPGEASNGPGDNADAARAEA